MIGKDLKKLRRRELVDVIYQMKKNEEELLEKISLLEASLKEKRIRIENAGSIASAASEITQLFTAAQNSADLYLSEIEAMKKECKEECERMIEDAKKKADEIVSFAEKEKSNINEEK